jgi:hypothetical protein
MSGQDRGAYGFRLVAPGLENGLPGLIPVPDDAPTVSLDWRRASARVGEETVEADRVVLARRRLNRMEVRRDPAEIILHLPEALDGEAIVHPLLTPPMAILARWRGDLTLHAGAFVSAGRAWGLVGEREAGKSTTLARLAERGCPIVADDLLVLQGTTAYAGPACIDLRPDVAERMPDTHFLGEVAGRPRHRMATPSAPPQVELGGFFVIGWSQDHEVRVEPLGAEEGLKAIYGHEYIGLLGPAEPERILDLLGTPMWRVSRPSDWAPADEAIERMLEITQGQAAPARPATRPA